MDRNILALKRGNKRYLNWLCLTTGEIYISQKKEGPKNLCKLIDRDAIAIQRSSLTNIYSRSLKSSRHSRFQLALAASYTFFVVSSYLHCVSHSAPYTMDSM